MDDDLFALTVRPRSTSGCWYGTSHSYAEIIAPREVFNPRGFCLNDGCMFRGYCCFRIDKAIFFDVFYTETRSVVQCPHCTHFLYWTKRYESPPREETRKNKRFKRRAELLEKT